MQQNKAKQERTAEKNVTGLGAKPFATRFKQWMQTGLPDFSCCNIPKREKIYQNIQKIYQMVIKIPYGCKRYQMDKNIPYIWL
jgi:hypothetical protein